jgi:hypothetical protein
MKIEFIPISKESELVVPRPKPAKNYIPQWYKDVPRPPKELEFSSPGEISNLNIKSCIPFLDSYNEGYIQETWTDIYISSEDGQTISDYNWPIGPTIMSHRRSRTGFKISNLFYDMEFMWHEQWLPKTPEGYSVIYTSPLNRFDLPFRSLDAVIDSDKYYHQYGGNYPFYIEKGFSGVIPAGTPMYQIIPIKRENWNSSQEKYDADTHKVRNHLIRKHLTRGYQKLFWQKKNFN